MRKMERMASAAALHMKLWNSWDRNFRLDLTMFIVHPGISFSCQCEDGVVRNIQSLMLMALLNQGIWTIWKQQKWAKLTAVRRWSVGGFVKMVGGWPLASPQSPVPFPASLSWEEPSRQALVRLWDLEKWHFYYFFGFQETGRKCFQGGVQKYIGFFSLTISSSFPIWFQFKEDCPFQKGNRQSSKCHRYGRYIYVKFFGGLG